MKKNLIVCLIFMASCKSYTIESSSLKSQLETTKAVDAATMTYAGENLKSLKVVNGKDNSIVLQAAKPIVLKVVRKDGFKFKYYLSAVSLNNRTFSGMGPTYLVGGMIHTVHMDSIQSIKVKN